MASIKLKALSNFSVVIDGKRKSVATGDTITVDKALGDQLLHLHKRVEKVGGKSATTKKK